MAPQLSNVQVSKPTCPKRPNKDTRYSSSPCCAISCLRILNLQPWAILTKHDEIELCNSLAKPSQHGKTHVAHKSATTCLSDSGRAGRFAGGKCHRRRGLHKVYNPSRIRNRLSTRNGLPTILNSTNDILGCRGGRDHTHCHISIIGTYFKNCDFLTYCFVPSSLGFITCVVRCLVQTPAFATIENQQASPNVSQTSSQPPKNHPSPTSLMIFHAGSGVNKNEVEFWYAKRSAKLVPHFGPLTLVSAPKLLGGLKLFLSKITQNRQDLTFEETQPTIPSVW